HAEASDEASVSKEAATTNAATVRPISSSSGGAVDEVTRGDARRGAHGIGRSFWWVRLAKMRAPAARVASFGPVEGSPRGVEPFSASFASTRSLAPARLQAYIMTDQSVSFGGRARHGRKPKDDGKAWRGRRRPRRCAQGCGRGAA